MKFSFIPSCGIFLDRQVLINFSKPQFSHLYKKDADYSSPAYLKDLFGESSKSLHVLDTYWIADLSGFKWEHIVIYNIYVSVRNFSCRSYCI